MTDILTITTAVRLGNLLEAVQRNAHVGWTGDEGRRFDVRTGILRAVTNERGGFWGDKEDVREAFVWITTTDTGMEDFRAISNILEMMERQTFVLDYDG